jgi:hypothetical protein
MSAIDPASIPSLAVDQARYHLYGCALPYWTPTSGEPSEQVQYQSGCAVQAIEQQKVELLLERVRFSFLCNQRGGLYLWDGPGGIYFSAALPDTAFARAIYEAVRNGQIRHVCAMGTAHQRFIHPPPTVPAVTAYDMLTINLLLPTSTPHLPSAIVTHDREAFEQYRRRLDGRLARWLDGRLAGGEGV